MSRLPTVAIIGRPNTGKSTLFNRLVGRRQAIVSEIPGTTRDHVASRVEAEEMDYLLIDTGGIGGGSADLELENDVSAQSITALASSDLILFTVDATSELTSSDFRVVETLRKKRKRHVPVILIATKCDRSGFFEERFPDLVKLGIAEHVIEVSAFHNIGTEELQKMIADELTKLHFKKENKEAIAEAEASPRIAIIGKPNVGKSSLINALMSDPQRESAPRLVSPIPGTTRDASDTVIKHAMKEYVFIDTAGLRRHAKVEEELESISVLKSIQAVSHSDLTILVLEAKELVSKQDKRIANLASEEGKGLIVLINKADLLTKEERQEKLIEAQNALAFCRFASFLFVSAQTRDGVLKIFPLIETVIRNRLRRISTKELHNWFAQALQSVPSQALARAKHLTQAKDPPPTFVLFVRNPKVIKTSELKYLEGSLRRTFAFEGTPIRWITKEG